MNLFTEQKQIHRYRKQIYGKEGRDKLRVGDSRCSKIYSKYIFNTTVNKKDKQ